MNLPLNPPLLEPLGNTLARNFYRGANDADCQLLSYTAPIADQARDSMERFSRIRAVSELDLTLRRLRGILGEEFDSREEEIAVTHAVDRAERILAAAVELVRDEFRRGWVSIHPEFGIRIEWQQEGRHLRVIVGASNESPGYIYFEEPNGDQRVIDGPSPSSLAEGLTWLYETATACV